MALNSLLFTIRYSYSTVVVFGLPPTVFPFSEENTELQLKVGEKRCQVYTVHRGILDDQNYHQETRNSLPGC